MPGVCSTGVGSCVVCARPLSSERKRRARWGVWILSCCSVFGYDEGVLLFAAKIGRRSCRLGGIKKAAWCRGFLRVVFGDANVEEER